MLDSTNRTINNTALEEIPLKYIHFIDLYGSYMNLDEVE